MAAAAGSGAVRLDDDTVRRIQMMEKFTKLREHIVADDADVQ
jgi:hypothetical protein